jgi:hypothetical protein
MAVIVLCDGGLGNRLRGLISAIYFLEGIDYEILWPIDEWCGISYTELFEEPFFAKISQYTVENIIQMLRARPNTKLLSHSKHFNVPDACYIPISTIICPRTFINNLSSSTSLIFCLVQIHPLIPIRVSSDIMKGINIKGYILEAASSAMQTMSLSPYNYFGFHCRLSDSGYSPAKYVNQIRSHSNKSSLPVFLCSDEPNRVLSLLPLESRTFIKYRQICEPSKRSAQQSWQSLGFDSYNRPTNYNIIRSSSSIVDALIDLVILSRSRIVYTNRSSFLEIALLLAYPNISLIALACYCYARAKEYFKYLIGMACR